MDNEKPNFRDSVEKIADAVIEDLREGYQSELEPFESYSQRVREQIHSNMEDFHTKFLRGYEVLLTELAEQKTAAAKTEDKPPPGAVIL